MKTNIRLAATAMALSTLLSAIVLGAAPAAPAAAPAAPGAVAAPGGPGGGAGRGGRGPAAPFDQPIANYTLNPNKHTQLMAKAKAAADARKTDAPGSIDLYFEGDSITDFWESNAAYKPNFQQNFGGWNPGDFGISGDSTQGVLYRIKEGELDGVNPKVIVLLIGTNNIGNPGPDDTAVVTNITKGVEAVVDAMHKKAPAAKMVLMAITTRNTNPNARGGRRGGAAAPAAAPAPAPAPASAPNPAVVAPLMGTINKINANLEDFMKKNEDKTLTLKFLSINDKLADKDGILHPGMMGDGLHPLVPGYQVWADALKPILTEWLGAPAAK